MGTETLIGLGILLLFLAGVEILTILGLAAVALTLITRQFPLANISLTMFDALNLFPLIALPLFIVTGDLIAEGGIAQQIMRFSRSLVGWARGGLSLSVMVASAIFAAISGSNAATVATVGRVVLPSMREERYPSEFAAGTIAAGGVVGIVIPPSIAFVLYGITVGVSVSDLFIAGILPGLMMVTLMSGIAYTLSRRRGYGERVPFSWSELGRGFLATKYAVGAIAVILVGIYGGIFTPTEAGAVAAVYCLFVGMFITRKIKLRTIPRILISSSLICGLIAPIVAVAIVVSQNMAVLRIPEASLEMFMTLSDNGTVQLLLILALLLIVGCFMETAPSILLLSPLLVPIGKQLGLDPVHFGVIVVATLAAGFITPPFGLNLFVASAMSGVPYLAVSRAAAPYVAALVVALVLIAFIPQLSLIFVR